MKIGPATYVPSLRWRMGEYQALSRLSDEAKARIVPFVVVPEIEFDFEEWAPKKTIQEHVEPFPKRFQHKWGNRPAWIDVHSKIHTDLMDNGKLPIAHIFDELGAADNRAVPVISLDGTPALDAAVAEIVKRDNRGVGIRARIEHIMKLGSKSALETLIKQLASIMPKLT
jgi:hypothetical protein